MKHKTIDRKHPCNALIYFPVRGLQIFLLLLLLGLTGCQKEDDNNLHGVDPGLIESMVGRYTGACFVETHQNGIHFDTMPGEFFVDSIVPLTNYYQKFYVRGYFIPAAEFLIYNDDFLLDSFETRVLMYDEEFRRYIIDLVWLKAEKKWKTHTILYPSVGTHFAYFDALYSKP